MEITARDFDANVDKALKNPTLKANLGMLGRFAPALRDHLKETLPEFDALRDEAKAIKDHTLDHLDFYLEAFEQRVVEAGGRVHWARTGAEARDIVSSLCRDYGVKKVIKGKSMVTEEIELNPRLESDGVEVFETDLGEYIIQLRHEKPIHIVGPALHLNKDQVSDTFHEAHQKLGYAERKEEREELVSEAREVLRTAFRSADMGIIGANFLVAETGSVTLVTNEGNGDLSSSLPKHHVVVTGIEKLVPTLDDVSVFVRLLARAATGQDISNYTSFYSGPKQTGDGEGPETFDIVLVDNGRSDMLGSPVQDMLRCIRCGSCLNHCPVFTRIGGHAYGSIYPGPMGSVLTPALTSISQAAKLPNASTFCGRCEESCPVHIPLPKLMRHWRTQEFEEHLVPMTMRSGLALWSLLARQPGLYRMATRLGNFALRSLANAQARQGRGWVKKLPFLGGGWTSARDLRPPSGPTFLQQVKKRKIR